MHILPPDLKCSKCGAVNQYETFISRYGASGTRCTACGHEKRNPVPTSAEGLHWDARDLGPQDF